MSNKSTERLHNDLIKYDVNPKYHFSDVCEKCNKEFDFYGKNVKNRTITCPFCGWTMAFFISNYQ